MESIGGLFRRWPREAAVRRAERKIQLPHSDRMLIAGNPPRRRASSGMPSRLLPRVAWRSGMRGLDRNAVDK